MESYDWSTFKKRISIKAASHIIFDYWTKQGHIEKWFLSKAEFTSTNGQSKDRFDMIEPGDTYVWMWHGSDNVAEGEVLKTNKKDNIKFSFLGCIVQVEIKEENGETVVELIQSEIPLDEQSRINYYLGCLRGWTFYLTNLKSILEGGIDLRNRNKNLSQVINT